MDIDTKKSLLEKKLQQLRDGEKEPNDILEDIKFLIDFEECFDELQSNADACYTYEQMLKSIEDYIIETSSEEEKNFLQYKVLIPSILKMESAYLNGNFHMGTIGMNLCESYLKIADSKIMKVYLNELVYALENRDEDYAKKLKCTFQSGEANLDDLKDFLKYSYFDKKEEFLLILDNFEMVKDSIDALDTGDPFYEDDYQTRINALQYSCKDYMSIEKEWDIYFQNYLYENIPDYYLNLINSQKDMDSVSI